MTAANGVLKNDTDADGDTPITAGDVTQPTNGTVTLAADGSFTYTPVTGFVGTDTFTYRAADPSTAKSALTTVTIKINTAPVSQNDSYTATEDTTLTVTQANGVLKNDTDADSDPLTATVITQPAHGTVTLAANGSFTYTPSATTAVPIASAIRLPTESAPALLPRSISLSAPSTTRRSRWPTATTPPPACC